MALWSGELPKPCAMEYVGVTSHLAAREMEYVVWDRDLFRFLALLDKNPRMIHLPYGNEPQTLMDYLAERYYETQAERAHPNSVLRAMMDAVVTATERVDELRHDTAFHRICAVGTDKDVPLLKRMLEQELLLLGDSMLKNTKGESPLFLAVINNRHEMIKVLLEDNENVVLNGYTIVWTLWSSNGSAPRMKVTLRNSEIKKRYSDKPLDTITLCLLVKHDIIKVSHIQLCKIIITGDYRLTQATLQHKPVTIGKCFQFVEDNLEANADDYAHECIGCLRLLLDQQELFVPPTRYNQIIVHDTYGPTKIIALRLLKQEQVRRYAAWTPAFLAKQATERPWILARAFTLMLILHIRLKQSSDVVFMILAHMTCH